MDLSHLNEPQQLAVQHNSGPLLVLAGAGTGKTSVITHRIAHFVRERGVGPERILAVTFTNKAAREMAERARILAGAEGGGLDVGTFHRICGRLLRRHGSLLGLDPSFVIYDGDDQLQLLRRLIAERGLDPQRCNPRAVRSRLEAWKNQGWTPDAVQLPPNDPLGKQAQELYALYQQRCLQANAVDFSDMLLHCLTLLRDHDEVRRGCQTRWTHVLVDEYQDTNAVQYAWLQQLVTPKHSLTVVGDDDQSIYRWRGAEVGNILRFEQDFPGATVVRLEQNYRCTQTILDAANHVIAHNTARKGKTLFAVGRPGTPLSLRIYDTEREEGHAAAAAIAAALESGVPAAEVAILYRTNAQSRPLEDALRRRRVPHILYGGTRFYDRREVKDAIAYLRLLVNPRSTLDFLRVVNTPPRGVGKTSLDSLSELAAQEGVSLPEAARRGADRLRGRARQSLHTFVQRLDAWQAEWQNGEPLGRLLEHILQDSGYLTALQQGDSNEASERLDNLKELVAALDEHVAERQDASLQDFLEDVALATDTDNLSATGGQVALMTLHAAKGLEFSWVLLPGMEEGLFPHSRTHDDPAALEEERRLCYVGLTRAKHTLLLSAARIRTVFGTPQISPLSRFVGEIPPQLFDADTALRPREESSLHVDATVADDDYLTDPPDPDVHNQLATSIPPPLESKRGRRTPVAAVVLSPPSTFAPGTRVFHTLFKEGEVVKADMSGRRQVLTIRFPKPFGQKIIVAAYVERLPT